MRSAWLVIAGVLLVACPSSSTSSSDDGGAPDVTVADTGTVCDTFTHNGQPCSPASPIVCFQECDAGGCTCKGTPGGSGVWVCVTDTSCEPDGSPVEDSGQPQDDGAATDAGTDAPDGD